jgi:hypothetical protein
VELRVASGNIDAWTNMDADVGRAGESLNGGQGRRAFHGHRRGFRAHWRWKSRSCGSRPKTPVNNSQLISQDERCQFTVGFGQTTVAKYMAKTRRPPSQGWKTLLRNHAGGIASIDMFVVRTISFPLLYGFLVLRHSEILWLGVTAHPSAEWIARQLTESCGSTEPPECIIRDRDGAYGHAFIRRAMGIRIGRSPLGHLGKTLALHSAPHESSELRPRAEGMDFVYFLH